VTEKIAREIFTTPVHDEIRDSFLAYSLSVITSRAIPDVRDGLKPVQRRILYSLHERGLRPDRPHTKSAQVVGYCMGTLHPHGDSAIYDALVRMVQDFAMRVPLVDGHGNFGSLDDPPAAMRYSECRMTQAAMEMLADIDEGTVDFRDNYDGKHQEPEVLPARLPNLLINGTSGIAVGMATNLAPHNPGEVIAAALHLLDNPDATLDDLMAFVPAPHFPTGGRIVDRGREREAYAA
jgi:DNA gyrase subunit A